MNERNVFITVENLRKLKAALESGLEEAQDRFREYVTNKSFDLKNRFAVWSEFCGKKKFGHINEADAPLFGKMVDDWEPFPFERYETHDWEFFLDCFMDDTNEAHELCEKYNVTLEDVMEMLIETNFGSTTWE